MAREFPVTGMQDELQIPLFGAGRQASGRPGRWRTLTIRFSVIPALTLDHQGKPPPG
jgi:hypothetical protein